MAWREHSLMPTTNVTKERANAPHGRSYFDTPILGR